jgi:tetratricopeptide (TPR) repeat protein
MSTGPGIVPMLLAAVIAAAQGERTAPDPMVVARTLARDGDLRGDWAMLVEAHRRLAALPREDGAALRRYYLGYVDWRIGALAFLAGGPTHMIPHLARAAEELQAAIELDPRAAEAHALLATVCGVLIGADPSRAATLAPVLRQAARTAFSLAPDNPRVRLLRGMGVTLAPGGDRAAGLALWREALEAFQRHRRSDPRLPDWGEAEGWGWLGGVHLVAGEYAEARRAFDRALALRPDFWWVRRIARPQALASPAAR